MRHAARAAITPSPAIFVTERARELGQTAFESSWKVITKVHRSTFYPRSPFDLQRSGKDVQGNGCPSDRGMKAPAMATFERCAAKKDSLSGNKVQGVPKLIDC